MRSRSSLCFVPLLALVWAGAACNSDPKAGGASTPPVTAAVQAKASLVTPTLGGSVVAIGERQLELAVLENGSVLGQLYDGSGAVVAADLPKVAVDLRTRGGGRARAELGWQPARACLAGRAQLSAGLVADPIDIALELNGKVETATLSGYAILPFARFGGSVLAVGPHAVELVAQGDAVLAYVLEASGQARAGADLSLQLELAGGAPLALSWDAQRGYYRAQLDGKLDLSAQPLRLTLTAAGKSYVGAVRSLGAVAQARVEARAQLSASGQAQLDAPRLDAAAKLAAPSAGLNAAGSLKAGASASAGKLAAAQASASKAVSAKVSAQAPSLKLSKSASASTSVKKPSGKASASAKAGASFSFGK